MIMGRSAISIEQDSLYRSYRSVKGITIGTLMDAVSKRMGPFTITPGYAMPLSISEDNGPFKGLIKSVRGCIVVYSCYHSSLMILMEELPLYSIKQLHMMSRSLITYSVMDRCDTVIDFAETKCQI